MRVRAGRAALHLAGQRSGDLPLPHGHTGHWTLKLSTNLREFYSAQRRPLLEPPPCLMHLLELSQLKILGCLCAKWGFLIAKVLVGAFSVKLCEGSLTALLRVSFQRNLSGNCLSGSKKSVTKYVKNCSIKCYLWPKLL